MQDHSLGSWSEADLAPGSKKRIFKFNDEGSHATIESYNGYFSIYWNSKATPAEWLNCQGALQRPDDGAIQDVTVWAGAEKQIGYHRDTVAADVQKAAAGAVLTGLTLHSARADHYLELPQGTSPDSTVAVVSRAFDQSMLAELFCKTSKAKITPEIFNEIFAPALAGYAPK